ncbi:MAG: hypothetical protein JM58_04980 [Peptococcaceae bacterium BICA1-8]|nr:MAG: hypothetical protein JM58_04980 [Peptococcaceae bacterium BICA1-8]
MKWLTVNCVEELPKQWDQLAGENIFLKRCFLKHLETVNPCHQTYNMLLEADELKAVYVDYRLKLDIFTYSFLALKIPVTIMGIPCSVSKQGFSICSGFEETLLANFQEKKGAKLILNSALDLPAKRGNTLPTCKMEIRWPSFGQYLESLRSPYRYRIKKAQNKWQAVKVDFIRPQEFDKDYYQLYEEVHSNSQAKLEKLNFEFFQQLPLASTIIKATHKEQKLGFAQIVENGTELIFLFIGFNHHLNSTFDIYLNLLLEIIGFAIDNRFRTIDLGQTAEETKLKLGSELFSKSMYISHSNLLLDKLANQYINLFSYQVPIYDFRVLKMGETDENFIS